jgi:hypothetical protein
LAGHTEEVVAGALMTNDQDTVEMEVRVRKRTARRKLHHPDKPITISMFADHDASGTKGYRPFLERLAVDDTFRQKVMVSPDKALAEYQIEFTPPLADAMTHGFKMVLPEKKKIKQLIDGLKPAKGPKAEMGHFALIHEFWTVITTGARQRPPAPK